jgi:serine/threonine-protein kinase/endoribonuclease IRE1
MPRRPPGAGTPSLFRLAAYLLLLSSTPTYASLQQKPEEFRRSRPEDGVVPDHRAPSRAAENGGNLEATRYPAVNEGTAHDADRSSAASTLALASNAVRAPKSALGSNHANAAGGLSSLLNARSLQDWEVEDFILLATVDGSLYAVNRTTGAEKWNLMMEKPMVESTYYRENLSTPENYRPGDDSLWIVEPSRDGDLYRYTYGRGPGTGLQRLGLTVKRLTEQSPWAEDDVVFTADKKTTLYTVDAATGKVTKEFKPGGGSIFQSDDQSCRRLIGLEGGDQDECGTSGSMILGRTEYTVGIQHRDTAEPICTFVYAEWGPNNYDFDLHGQYRTTMDHKYVYPRHDGNIFAFDHSHLSPRGEPQRVYKQRLPSPVVRVFDIVKPLDTEDETITRDTHLVVLPQPIAPIESDEYLSSDEYRNRVFVNHTDAGGWFAMSEATYPTVTGGAQNALCYSEDWLALSFPSAILSAQQKQEALIGVHFLDAEHNAASSRLTISGPQPQPEISSEAAGTRKSQPSPMTSNFVLKNSKIIQTVSDYNAADAVILSVITILVSLVLSASKWTRFFRNIFKDQGVFPKVDQQIRSVPTSPITSKAPDLPYVEATGTETPPPEKPEDDGQLTPTTAQPGTKETTLASDISENKDDDSEQEVKPRVQIVEPTPSPGVDDEGTETPTPKKKARRGTRGGTKHRKKKPTPLKTGDEAEGTTETSQEGSSEGVQAAVRDALHINEKPTGIQPDLKVVNETATAVTDVTLPVVQIGHLKVQMDNVLGYGSQGTVVYKGSFGGRDVAVKRMLQEFYDIASHEVGLLQESDDHPNVIRYYDKESAGEFLYIALELCPASLQEVVERPLAYPSLVGTGGLDPPNTLKQITAGLRYLHSLKIIHRDIKPQNILISTPKKLPTAPNAFQPPRLLISDFGLCKKLEGDQSSFRATTAHAAGTSGWRAPELLVDEDTLPNGSLSQSSQTVTSAHSASEPQVLDTQSNRRATRAIDIFSLGCVFYYVLTDGSHPFDRDGKYMREANIVKGRYTLGELDRLGDYRREAEDLVASMLSQEPRDRPDAASVLIHPFFWTAAQRLDFLCHVSDAFEFEPRDPPSSTLQVLEAAAARIIPESNRDGRRDFLRELPPAFKDNLGKQRKYDGGRVLDLLRALRNKKNHYEDMPDNVKRMTGPLPEGYLGFWTRKFPELLIACRDVVMEVGWDRRDRFKTFFEV